MIDMRNRYEVAMDNGSTFGVDVAFDIELIERRVGDVWGGQEFQARFSVTVAEEQLHLEFQKYVGLKLEVEAHLIGGLTPEWTFSKASVSDLSPFEPSVSEEMLQNFLDNELLECLTASFYR